MARACLIASVVLVLGLAAWWLQRLGGSPLPEPIRVGVLHWLSGTMAISERSVAEATLLAIEEINAAAGLLGRTVEPIVADGRSDAPTFAAEAQRLIAEAQVQVIFGCWTSASRKSVMPVVERYRHLLFYPVQYEGLEASPHIVYTGSAPNQQILPCVKWAFDAGGPGSAPYTALAEETQRFLARYNASAGYEDAYFISLEGRVIASARRRQDFGIDLRTPPYRDTELARVFERVLMLMSTELSDFSRYAPAGKPVAFIATALFQHPHLVGVAAFQLSNDEVYRVVNDYTGLGRTGETVIASRQGNDAVFITPTRHDPDAAFQRRVPIGSALGRPIQEAIQARKGSGLAVDYRGQEILAIWQYVPYLHAGMVVQIETAEAFGPVVRLRMVAAVIAAATLIAAILAAVFVAQSLANPIVRLTAMARSLADDDLTRRIDVPARNEIGELAASFNDMAGHSGPPSNVCRRPRRPRSGSKASSGWLMRFR